MKRIQDFDKKLPIVELYTAVQSEGSRAGYPTVVIRTTGCTHRCYFGEGGWCDSWYTSIHPEKGGYTFGDIIRIYEANPHIKEMMLTGGSPTMHPALVNELTHFARSKNIFITMETEGSVALKTDYPIHLMSISPKFSNSVPKLGVPTPLVEETTQRMIDQHNKFRANVKTIAEIILNQWDTGVEFHLKPVWDGEDREALEEILQFNTEVVKYLTSRNVGWFMPEDTVREIVRDSTWFMPAGDTREALFKSYPKVFDWVRDNGHKMTWRPHIIAFEDQREV